MSSARSDSAENDDHERELEEELEDSISECAPSDATEEQMENDDDDRSVEPSILDDLSEPDFDEVRHGRNYDQVKDAYDRQQRCIEMLVDDIREKKREIRGKNRELKAKTLKIQQLENRLAGISEPPVPWSHLLRAYFQGEVSYYSIPYRQCCKQENMSQKLYIFHPDFSLQDEEISKERRAIEERLVLEERRARLLALERVHDESDIAEPETPPMSYFPFQELPLEIQVKIFRQLFVKGTLIHCLSRLDPSNPPVAFPDKDVEGESQLPTRFHFGKSPCQIILACKPNDVLKPLLVCKRWYFIGVHAFYGANTFAFSSLGEWHRFCNGIGPARVQRLVNVELMWHGSLMRRHETRISQRSLGLKWFTKTRRLRTLVVHIAECDNSRTRRKYEIQKRKKKNRQQVDNDGDRLIEDQSDGYQSDGDESDGSQSDVDQDLDKGFDPFETMVRRTLRHPNYRKFRSMRTVQGIDYLYQLRAMDWIRFKERNGLDHRQSIRDWSFLKDLSTVVTLPKQDDLALKSHLENLTPLTCLEDFIPSGEDMLIIKTFYDETHILGPVGGSETTGSANGAFSDTASWGGTSISDSDDDDDDDNPQDRHVPNLRNAPNAPVPEIIDLDSNPNSDTEPDSDDDDDDAGGFGVSDVSQNATTITLVGASQQRNNRTQGDESEGGRMDIDDDDGSSSGLFVRSGSGSGSPPADPMEIDDPTEQVNHEVIDLTGDQFDDEDDESSLFVRSEPDTGSVKIEPEDDDPNDLYPREETPPGSDDESDIYPYPIPSGASNANSSPRQSSEGEAHSHDEGQAAKRRRLG
ncbi:hypothetical protein F4813DRAFT_396981 [Daldinia decipiens]|uniref:uncharacterized protein n=1 Tax=Daldinia decipiens TaxID=326647 RepID=UPI0020C3F8B1|nr:uncharacterized protein F4813DRAFT_396981 [Daldinia decipiens]KAI1662364.1 hypothetical protein F4813DRAFT_396981 [Daldinia decipiens]